MGVRDKPQLLSQGCQEVKAQEKSHQGGVRLSMAQGKQQCDTHKETALETYSTTTQSKI